MRKACAICGFTRVVDRAHIIPKVIASEVRGMRRYASYDRPNWVYLCRNHHLLFDTHRLTTDEQSVLVQHFTHLRPALLQLLNSDIETHEKNKKKYQYRGLKRKFEKWRLRMGQMLVTAGWFEYKGEESIHERLCKS